MRSSASVALDQWERDSERLQQSAAKVLRTAFPLLAMPQKLICSCPTILGYDHPKLGTGKLCVDDYGRATIEFEDVPNEVLAEAIDAVFGIAWFDGADRPLSECGPGAYGYDCESSGEYEVVLGTEGMGKLYCAFIPVPDATAVLDALNTASGGH